MSLVRSLSEHYGDNWVTIVASGELNLLRRIVEEAKKDVKERKDEFLALRSDALSKGDKTFFFRDKEYKITKNVKDNMLKYFKTRMLEQRKGLYSYRMAEPNSWIFKTLLEKKQRKLFDTCEKLVMVGCGLYPYSMFDIHKKFKHIKQVGIEIEPKRASVAKSLVANSPAKDSIAILNMDGLDFDYSKLQDDDLIFISCDVDNEEIIKKIIKTSKAHFFVCAPYARSWLKEVIYKSNFVMSEDGSITSISDT